jgi:hypothetical protein
LTTGSPTTIEVVALNNTGRCALPDFELGATEEQLSERGGVANRETSNFRDAI